MRGYGEAADHDKGFQLAMLGSDDLAWDGIEQEKDAFAEAVTPVINRAIAAGVVRHDLTFNDFPMLTCGILATMYFKPGGNDDGAATSSSSSTGLTAATRDPRLARRFLPGRG